MTRKNSYTRLYCLLLFTSRTWTDNEAQGLGKEMKRYYFHSLQDRGFESLVLLNANDADVYDFIQNFPHGAKNASSLVLRCCNLRCVQDVVLMMMELFGRRRYG